MCNVSIVIPTYNRADTIKRAIDSVLAQSYEEFELIVVDDGSTDDTCQIVNEYQDTRVRYIKTEKKHGANYARNIGIQNAVGEYIAFQDSDDFWHRDKLGKQMEIFRLQDDVDIVFSRFVRRLLDGSEEVIPNKNFTQKMLGRDIAHILSRENVASTQTMIVRKKCFEQYGVFDIEMPRLQDWEINVRFAQKARFFCVDEALVDVYESQNSITNAKGNGLRGLALLVKKHTNFFMMHGMLEYHLGILFAMAAEEKKASELAELLGKELFYESIYANARKNLNTKINYAFVKKWVMDESCERRVNNFLAQYFEGNVIIYGVGDIGKLLISKLSNESKKKIKFLIDKNISQSMDYPIKRLKDVNRIDLTGVKCFIVTAIAHMDEIESELQGMAEENIKIVNLQNIINGEY